MLRSEAFYKVLIDNASELICVVDRAGIRTYVSPSYRRVLGYDAEQLLDRHLLELVHPEDFAEAYLEVERFCTRHGAEAARTLRIRDARGRWRTLHVRAKSLIDDPAVSGVVVTSQDITERERLASQVHRAQKMEAIGRMAAGIAHDFNNLITVIEGNVTILEEDSRSAEEREAISEVHHAARRAHKLARELLALGRAQPVEPKSIDLRALVGGMQGVLRRLLGPEISLDLRLQPVPSILGHRERAEQVLLNLVANARDAMPEGGRVIISARVFETPDAIVREEATIPAGSYVRLDVEDSGNGMSGEVLRHIFEPFFSTKSPDKGSGLGLATVYAAVQEVGGYVTVDSRLGHGTMFSIFFKPSPR